MFTPGDIREIAIQIERNGEESYRRAADQIADAEVTAVFRWMADEEAAHAKWFAALPLEQGTEENHQEAAAIGRGLLRDMVRDQTFSLEEQRLASVHNLQEMLTQSIGFEEDTIMFYEFLGSLINDPETLEQLKVIIAEERRHAVELKRLALTLAR